MGGGDCNDGTKHTNVSTINEICFRREYYLREHQKKKEHIFLRKGIYFIAGVVIFLLGSASFGGHFRWSQILLYTEFGQLGFT